MMKILVTGAEGFIGKNLVVELKNKGYEDIFPYSRESEPSLLDRYCRDAAFVFHLAGVNRPKEQREFMEGNAGFTSTLLDRLKKYDNPCPVMFSSSIQAELENPYGKSKKAAEDLLFRYSKETGARVLVYRFPNVFGKWCRSNYNSAVATFCYNIARDLPVTVHDPGVEMNLVYIDDLLAELLNALRGKEHVVGAFCQVPVVHTITLGEIVNLLNSLKKSRRNGFIPDMSDGLTKKLYSTYLSYLPRNQFSYALNMHEDARGSFTEFFKTPERGQVSVNISRPGITKGNHWHHTKNEKFLVVSGEGVIRFRSIDSQEIIEYHVSGKKLEVVEIPPGYTHNIENLGDTNLVTVMWSNEPFNPDQPDTYPLEV